MADVNLLYGSCACERNQYTVIVPNSAASLAQVFFDNSVANRRSQATPVTAWLRVPLDWYHSTTFAHFPDETSTSIKRIFTSHESSHAHLTSTRRQFCGYCGTHLTAWTEGPDVVDVTLGSMYTESLELLERLKMYQELESDEEGGLVRDRETTSTMADGRVKDPNASINEPDHIRQQVDGRVRDANATVNEPDHIRQQLDGRIKDSQATVNEPDHIRQQLSGLVRDPHASFNEPDHVPVTHRQGSDFTVRPPVPHRMNHRGVPYFEEMVENSRLGWIKRQSGGGTSVDGRVRVQWEIIDMSGDDDELRGEGGGTGIAEGNKRLKMDA